MRLYDDKLCLYEHYGMSTYGTTVYRFNYYLFASIIRMIMYEHYGMSTYGIITYLRLLL